MVLDVGLDEEEVVKIWNENRKEKGEKNRKKWKRENRKYEIFIPKSDYSCVEHKIWFECDEIFWKRVPKDVLVEIMNANKY